MNVLMYNSDVDKAKVKDEGVKEDRKDSRVDRQAGHQANLARERSGANPVKKFESSGNDVVTGGADLKRFMP